MAYFTLKKRLVLFFIFIFFYTISYSQQKGESNHFSDEFSVFLTEMENFMSKSKNSELKETFKIFRKNRAAYTLSEQKLIIDISNNMYQKRCKPKPHFNYFFTSFSVVSKYLKSDILRVEWLEVVMLMIQETTNKKLLKFLAFTELFLEEGILRSSKSAKWKVNTQDFHFGFEVNTPVISFSDNLDLSCINNDGRIDIFSTKGVFYPILNEWVGGNGTINWINSGFSSDSVYAQLSNYKLDVRKNSIIADSCIFHNKYIFTKPIIGKVINKILPGSRSRYYPSFVSYSKNIEIKDVFDNIDYKGGYMLNGKDFIADGGDFAEARIIFKREGKEIFIASSERFNINSDRISSQSSSIKIFFDNDSIYHSNLSFKYINSSRKLELYRNKKSGSAGAMFNTYHKVIMDFELLEWNIDTDIITFGSLPGSSQSLVNFESIDMYSEDRFTSLQGIDAIHPLILINNYIRDKGEDIFYVEDFARYTRFPINQIEHYLISLARDGFIFYDLSQKRIFVQPMLYNYITAASGLGDYDVISFRSVVNVGQYNVSGEKHLVNAALNLNNKDLNILGIQDIEISKKRGVYLSPYSGRLILKKNRDFVFNGQIYAGKGRFNLFGREFYFHYDDFKIDLNKIDSIQLSVPVKPIKQDMYGNDILTQVKTVIEAVTGELRIDDPSNKSGIKVDSFPGFPIFRSFDDSYAYYDRNSIYNGVYSRDNFSFNLDPFEIDSLDNYTGQGLWFSGTFKSAGIFPIFNDTLRLQNDYSLGINTMTPKSGFPLYGGEGRYYQSINLSHDGLRGDGDFEYLTSSSNVNEIIFFPDSANFYTNTFRVNEVVSGIEFPNVLNTETYAHFEPYEEKLVVNKFKKEFDFYKGDALLDGDILLQPTSLTGSGKMLLDKAEINSHLFTYNANWFGADTASLNVFEVNGDLAFKANNLRSHIDLSLREGTFYSNGIGSYVTFPANQYLCYIDKLHWEMDNEILMLGEVNSENSDGSEFISIHPLQDSLHFVAKTSMYSMRENIIYASGVNEILIADAIIYPDSGLLNVVKEGVIETLFNSRILTNDLTQYHSFYNAKIDIKSANNYLASGDYLYKDAMNNTQDIFFNEIYVNLDTITFAKGNIREEDSFFIGNKFNFKGSVELFSDQRDLIFDGHFKLNHNCNSISREWINFRSQINITDIAFDLGKEVYNENGNILSSSLVFSPDSSNFYTTFLSGKKRAVDVNIIEASNRLSYDQKKDEFTIGGPDSLTNFYILNNSTCTTRGRGEIDLNLDIGRVNIRSIGEVKHDISLDKVSLDGLLMLDFFFSEEAMEIMAKDIYSAPGDGIFEYDNNFSYNLKRLLGKEQGEKALLDLELHDTYSKFPKEINYSLVFPKNSFSWDNINKAYVSKGDIWISNIYDSELNALLTGYIIIEKGRKSDILTVYLQTEFYDEYYFNYKNGVMRAWSTNPDFNNAINDVSDKKRKLDNKRSSRSYRYLVADEDATEKFIKTVENKY